MSLGGPFEIKTLGWTALGFLVSIVTYYMYSVRNRLPTFTGPVVHHCYGPCVTVMGPVIIAAMDFSSFSE